MRDTASEFPDPMTCLLHATTGLMTLSPGISSWQCKQGQPPNLAVSQNNSDLTSEAQTSRSASIGKLDDAPPTPVNTDIAVPSAANSTKRKHVEELNLAR